MIEIKDWHFSNNFKSVEGLFYTEIENEIIGLNKNIDLISGKYEGGLKLWECSLDLLKYLKSFEVLPYKVLELGCGHGLPGIFCAQQNCLVTFQDYNKEVLEYVTVNNVVKNLGENKCRYFYGPWGDISSMGSFDLVITSETIYNPQNYSDLLNAIYTSNAPFCLVACKSYYFGVGGGSEMFMKAAESIGFKSEIVVRIDEIASTRLILRLSNPNV
jgi:SAM-dependent methyltransferase